MPMISETHVPLGSEEGRPKVSAADKPVAITSDTHAHTPCGSWRPPAACLPLGSARKPAPFAVDVSTM